MQPYITVGQSIGLLSYPAHRFRLFTAHPRPLEISLRYGHCLDLTPCKTMIRIKVATGQKRGSELGETVIVSADSNSRSRIWLLRSVQRAELPRIESRGSIQKTYVIGHFHNGKTCITVDQPDFLNAAPMFNRLAINPSIYSCSN